MCLALSHAHSLYESLLPLALPLTLQDIWKYTSLLSVWVKWQMAKVIYSSKHEWLIKQVKNDIQPLVSAVDAWRRSSQEPGIKTEDANEFTWVRDKYKEAKKQEESRNPCKFIPVLLLLCTKCKMKSKWVKGKKERREKNTRTCRIHTGRLKGKN